MVTTRVHYHNCALKVGVVKSLLILFLTKVTREESPAPFVLPHPVTDNTNMNICARNVQNQK